MKRRETCQILVIGAGPAGLSAAEAAREAGADVVLLDAYPTPGGQYWMQPPADSPASKRSKQAQEGAGALEAARRAGVRILISAEVWGIYPGFRVAGTQEGRALEIEAETIVVATGAHDRVLAFPGWTLPGVVTPGAAQRLAKLNGVTPGRHVVLSGSGPFLLAVARELLAAGVESLTYVEAQRPGLSLAAFMARYPERWRELAGLLRPLATACVSLRIGWVVTAAEGDGRVEGVRIAPLSKDGRIDRDREQRIAGVDSLCIGYGFRPSIDVTALLRCRHDYDERRGGWYCHVDPLSGQTSMDKVYAVGEVTGIGGAIPARISGRIAGFDAARSLGFPGAGDAEMGALRRRLHRARSFAEGLNRRFAPPPDLESLVTGDTVVCRCEDVTGADLREAIADGAATLYGVKAWTRAGMGRCQGRICGWTLARLIAGQTGVAVGQLGFNQPHIPLLPVPLTIVQETLEQQENPAGP